MRTLQEKYNGIQEGTFSKEHFLAEARMQQPQLVTRFNGYNDAVQILKNRGMIVEAKKAEGKKVTDTPFIVYTDKQGKHHIEEQNFEDDQKAFLKTIPNTWDVYETRKEALAEKERRLKKDKKETVKEAYSAEESFKDYSDDALTDMIINSSRFEGNEEGIARVKAELARRKSTVAEISSDTFKSAVDVARGRGEDRRASKLGSTFLNSFVGKPLMGGTISKIDIQKPSFGDYFDATLEVLVPTQGTQGMYDKPKYLYYDVENDDWGMKGKGLEVSRQDARVLSQVAIKVNPDTKYRQGTQHFDIVGMNEAKLTKKSLTDYRYKPTNDMDKYPYEQILRGIRVELEALQVLGTPTAEEYSKALAKVSKNLEKDSIFYTNQVAGVNPKVDLHDKMVTATVKNTVDTFNGMKKAALKEGFKRLIKKVLSENSNDLTDLFNTSDEPQGKGEYEFYSDPENYNEEEEFELQGDEDLDESKTGDVHILAQESDTLRDFLIAVKQQYPQVDIRRDIKELQHIWNSREEDQIDYDDDENFSDPLIDGEDDLYEMQGPKSDNEYKSKLANYLEDNQIYGYTKRIHDIMTGPDEAENVDELVRYLEDNQIYGYGRAIERIYADYPYDEYYKNQLDDENFPDPSGVYEGKKSLSELLK